MKTKRRANENLGVLIIIKIIAAEFLAELYYACFSNANQFKFMSEQKIVKTVKFHIIRASFEFERPRW